MTGNLTVVSPTSTGETVTVDAVDLARFLHDAALFCDTGKDAAKFYRGSVELTVARGVMHACALNEYAAGWARADVEWGKGEGRAVLSVVDATKIAQAVTPRRNSDDDDMTPHVIDLVFHGTSLAVSMIRTDDDTEPDWSTDVRCPLGADLFGPPLFPDVPKMLRATERPTSNDAADWIVLASQLAVFTRTRAAKGNPIVVDMLAPLWPASRARMARVRIGELFTGGFTTRDPAVPIGGGDPEPPVHLRAATSEATYTRPDVVE